MKEKPVIPIDQAWEKWKDCLGGTDRNSIVNQLFSFVWNTGIYRLILECRQLSIDQNPSNPKFNNPLHIFIDRGFFQTQAIAIRRLTDDSSGITGDYGIYSIKSMLKELKSRREELNRKKFFELQNIPYDIELMKIKHRKFINEQVKGTDRMFIIPKDQSPDQAIETHVKFDQISLVEPKNRQPTDLISLSFFDDFEKRLAIADSVKVYVDKCIAHAASPESRDVKNFDEIKISLQQLWDLNQVLCEATNFLANLILGAMYVFLPLEPVDFFDYWDEPWVSTQKLDYLRSTYENYRKETEEWK